MSLKRSYCRFRFRISPLLFYSYLNEMFIFYFYLFIGTSYNVQGNLFVFV